MKRFNFVIVVLAILMFVFLLSCSKGREYESQVDLLSFQSFEKIGKLHNDFMTNVQNNFKVRESVKSLNARIDYVNSYHLNYLENCSLSQFEKETLGQELERAKNLTDVENIKQLLTIKNEARKDANLESLCSILDKALDCKCIDEFEYTALTRIMDLAKLSFDGLVSQHELMSSLEKMKKDWISNKYKIDSKAGYISGYAIAISLASMNWWEENAEAGTVESKGINVIPVWVAADAVGAVWGAASGAIGSYVINDEVNWESVGWGALSGAVAGSTGVVGKVGKWLSNIL